MEEEDNIIVKWAQEYVETSYNLINKINYEARKPCHFKWQMKSVVNDDSDW